MVAADAGLMQIQLGEGARSEVYRGCAAEHGPSRYPAQRCVEQESMANAVVEEAWRQICLALSQRDRECARHAEFFELKRAVSCSSG